MSSLEASSDLAPDGNNDRRTSAARWNLRAKAAQKRYSESSSDEIDDDDDTAGMLDDEEEEKDALAAPHSVKPLRSNSRGGTRPKQQRSATKDRPVPLAAPTIIAAGTRIYKQFRAGWFWGQIVAVSGRRVPLYRVVYEDGDSEDFNSREVAIVARNARRHGLPPTDVRLRLAREVAAYKAQPPEEDDSASEGTFVDAHRDGYERDGGDDDDDDDASFITKGSTESEGRNQAVPSLPSTTSALVQRKRTSEVVAEPTRPCKVAETPAAQSKKFKWTSSTPKRQRTLEAMGFTVTSVPTPQRRTSATNAHSSIDTAAVSRPLRQRTNEVDAAPSTPPRAWHLLTPEATRHRRRRPLVRPSHRRPMQPHGRPATRGAAFCLRPSQPPRSLCRRRSAHARHRNRNRNNLVRPKTIPPKGLTLEAS